MRTVGMLACLTILGVLGCDTRPATRDLTPLVQAIHAGDVETVQSLLKEDRGWATSRGPGGMTPLHYTVAGLRIAPEARDRARAPVGSLTAHDRGRDIAELLLAHGADPNVRNAEGSTPLHGAVKQGHKDIAEILLAHGANVNAPGLSGMTPLHTAAYTGNRVLADVLLAHQANVNAREGGGWTPLHRAVAGNHEAVVDLLLAHGADLRATTDQGFPPLFLAATQAVAELLIAHGADVTARAYEERTPLHQAAMQLRPGVVIVLLARDVEVDARDARGQTPLLLAISGHYSPVGQQWSREIVEQLLSHGADPNAADKEAHAPLRQAVAYNRRDLIELLLHNAAAIDGKDQHGYTALHWAVSQKQPELVALLLARGADVNARNLQGRTPLYDTWGGSESDKAIAALLRQHGGVK